MLLIVQSYLFERGECVENASFHLEHISPCGCWSPYLGRLLFIFSHNSKTTIEQVSHWPWCCFASPTAHFTIDLHVFLPVKASCFVL